MPSLAELRARVKEQNKNRQDTSVFPVWKMNDNSSTIIRLLPWEDPLTGLFFTESKMIPMKFIDPSNDENEIYYNAPCLEMYSKDQKCPVLNKVREIWNIAKDYQTKGLTKEHDRYSAIGKKHWIKPAFYYQGFVIKSGLQEDTEPENPIRVFRFSKEIHINIYNSVFSEEALFERLPTGEFTPDDIKLLLSEDCPSDKAEEIMRSLSGVNYKISKTKKGEYSTYSTSQWMRDDSDLSDEQIQAIHDYGFHNLREKLPDQPTKDQYDVMVDMIETSISYHLGEGDGLWNPDWETAGIKPWKKNADNSDSDEEETSSKSSRSTFSRKPATQVVEENVEEDEEEAPKSSISDKLKGLKRNNLAKASSDDEDDEPTTSRASDVAAAIKAKIQNAKR